MLSGELSVGVAAAVPGLPSPPHETVPQVLHAYSGIREEVLGEGQRIKSFQIKLALYLSIKLVSVLQYLMPVLLEWN